MAKWYKFLKDLSAFLIIMNLLSAFLGPKEIFPIVVLCIVINFLGYVYYGKLEDQHKDK